MTDANYPPCPAFEVGDTLKRRNDPLVYEVAQIDERGVLIWTKVEYVAKGFRYPDDELKSIVTWLWKPDGSSWTSPPDPSDPITKL